LIEQLIARRTLFCVVEPPKSLGPPTVVLIQRTSDNPVGAPDHLTSSVSIFFTLPKSVLPEAVTITYFIFKYRKSSIIIIDQSKYKSAGVILLYNFGRQKPLPINSKKF
jgi:hypothetical protein